MPQHTPAEKEKRRRNRSADEIARLDASEGGGGTPAKKPAKKPQKKERSGVGRDNSNANADRLGAALRARIEAARGADNLKMVNTLKARLKALEATRAK